MNFKLDENMPVEAADLLRAVGHDATTVFDEDLAGADDKAIAARVVVEGRALITTDLDFADIRAYPPREYCGIIVIRGKRQDKSFLLERVRHLLGLLQTEPLTQALWIVTPYRVRIRQEDSP